MNLNVNEQKFYVNFLSVNTTTSTDNVTARARKKSASLVSCLIPTDILLFNFI